MNPGVPVAREIERITTAAQIELRRRIAVYRGGRPAMDLRGRTAVVVGGGVATGLTDAVVTLRIPTLFRGVGDSYLDFRQVSDEEVIDALAGPARAAA